MRTTEGVSLLLRLDSRRLSDAFRNPQMEALAGVALPVALAAGGLWLAGVNARPDVSTGDGVILLGLLVAAPVSLQAYPILFRPADDGFLRRLGIPARALFGVRALRLLLVALVVVLALMIPFVSTRQLLARPLAVALAAAVGAWAVSLWAQARAAVRTAANERPLAMKTLGPDPELVAAGALVFAPLYPLVAGTAAARFAGAEVWTMPLRMLAVVALSLVVVPAAAAAFARALPRFAPHAGELAHVQPPDAGGGELVIGRGLARVLPRRV
ncbi:MAG TPA: hypothetical protein VM890_00840, partial [Longimicrobium sp.]|nr:hypothetical protein [Longimicrobium sp.]